MLEDKIHTMRFGDFVRESLKDPDSEISKATKRIKNWKYLVNKNKNYSIEYDEYSFDLFKTYRNEYWDKLKDLVEEGFVGWVGMFWPEKD